MIRHRDIAAKHNERLRSPNEVFSIAVPLVRRRGLQQIAAIDDQRDAAIVAEILGLGVVVNSITHEQQPFREALFDRVNPVAQGGMCHFLHVHGQVPEKKSPGFWKKRIEIFERNKNTYFVACAYAVTGDREPAFAALDEAVRRRLPMVADFYVDPRFDELARRIGCRRSEDNQDSPRWSS